MTKRYYWLQLQKNFFGDIRMKKLRKIAGGDTFTIIYLKMMLSSLENEGVITFEGIEKTLSEELALALDEDADNVQMTISFLINTGLMVDIGLNQFYLPEVAKNLGSEGASAKRVREYRERQKAIAANNTTLLSKKIESEKTEEICGSEEILEAETLDQKALHCNTDVTEVKHNSALHCNTDVTEVKQNSNGEKRREEKSIYKRDKETCNKSDKPTLSLNQKKRTVFTKPTIDQLKEYIEKKGYSLDAQEFFNYYEDRDWYCGKVPMRNWKNALYSWNKKQSRWGNNKISEENNKNSFQQNTYDFDKLEQDLVRN